MAPCSAMTTRLVFLMLVADGVPVQAGAVEPAQVDHFRVEARRRQWLAGSS